MLEVLRSGRLSLGPDARAFERGFADWLGADDAVARLIGDRGASSRRPGARLGRRRRGGDDPFSFVASANCLLYERATPVFCDIDPVTLNLDPARPPSAVGERTAGLLAGRHPRLPGGAARAGGARRRARARRARGRLRGARGDRRRRGRVGAPRQPGDVRLLRQQAADHGGGGHARRAPTPRSPRGCAASATRAAPATWAGSTTTGSASTTG